MTETSWAGTARYTGSPWTDHVVTRVVDGLVAAARSVRRPGELAAHLETAASVLGAIGPEAVSQVDANRLTRLRRAWSEASYRVLEDLDATVTEADHAAIEAIRDRGAAAWVLVDPPGATAEERKETGHAG